MQVNENISYSNGQVHSHMLYNTAHGRGAKLNDLQIVPVYTVEEVNEETEQVTESSESELVTEIEGKFGTIRVLKNTTENVTKKEDIHGLLARILLMKKKRLMEERASGE